MHNSKLKFVFSFVLVCCSQHLWANGAGSDLELNHVSLFCERPARKAILDCRQNLPAQAAGAVTASGEAAAGAAEGQNVAGIDAAGNIQSQGGNMNGLIANFCEEQASTCRSSCERSFNYHGQLHTTFTNQANQKAGTLLETPLRNRAQRQQERQARARSISDQYCGFLETSTVEKYYEAYGLQAAATETEVIEDLASGGNGEGEGFLGKLDGKNLVGIATGAAMLGMAGGCLFGSMCDIEDESVEEESEAETASVDCKLEENYNNRECEEGLLAICMENPDATNCSSFSELYCDLNGSGSGSASTSSGTSQMIARGEGSGSTFCSFQIEVEFCRSDTNSECPSCEKLRMKNNPVCESNPVACMPALSSSQIATHQEQCPADPMFASEEYIQENMENGTEPGSALVSNSESSTSQPLNELSGDGDGAIDYSEAMEQRGGVSESFSRLPASSGSSDSESLFLVNANAIKNRCASGMLNNCGPQGE